MNCQHCRKPLEFYTKLELAAGYGLTRPVMERILLKYLSYLPSPYVIAGSHIWQAPEIIDRLDQVLEKEGHYAVFCHENATKRSRFLGQASQFANKPKL
jgi:hypothetical protein